MNLLLLKFMRWLGVYASGFFVFVFITVFTHRIMTNSPWWYSWEWFHASIIMPFIWVVTPFLVLFLFLNYIFEKNSRILPDPLTIQKYPNVLRGIILFIVIVTCIATVSQVFGGCIWQLPSILNSVPGYQWRIYAFEYIADEYLLVLKLIASIFLYLFQKNILLSI